MSPHLFSRRHFLFQAAVAAAASALPPENAKPFRGIFIIMATPFTEAGAVDFEDLENEVRWLDRGLAPFPDDPVGIPGRRRRCAHHTARGPAVVLGDVAAGVRTIELHLEAPAMELIANEQRQAGIGGRSKAIAALTATRRSCVAT